MNNKKTNAYLMSKHLRISAQQDQQDALFTFHLFRLIACIYFEHFCAHHQEVLHAQRLVYFCAYYVGWQLVGSEWTFIFVPMHCQ
jgi:hypothetical protein